ENATPTPAPRDDATLVFADASVEVAPVSVDVEPAPQDEASMVRTDIMSSSHSTNSFSTSIDELFGGIRGGISGKVTSPP
ncbi:unnamed protein product, partial [Ilex paraguariensis]